MEKSESFGLRVVSDALDQVFDLLHSILFIFCQVTTLHIVGALFSPLIVDFTSLNSEIALLCPLK